MSDLTEKLNLKEISSGNGFLYPMCDEIVDNFYNLNPDEIIVRLKRTEKAGEYEYVLYARKKD